ncbi:uncharacterized protein LOC143289299 [Babylonia areolata]|uniref:uncharacterized protein LOC143289299 n=1 Tax=Babylonia areolata TaxID=304850 RepID=UPI003FD3A925
MPYWDEKSDDMESYLRRFEAFADQNKWDDSERSCYLSALLKGKALTYFQELSQEDAESFKTVKKHLLTRFQCTEEGFRTQFRSARPQPEETMGVFHSRVRRYFFRWLELAEIGKDFEKLADLLLREQILSGVSTQLVVRLPLSRVSLDTPYFAGTVEACVIENPVCDVILGRIEGSTFHCSEVVAAVVTRAQAARL